ncbi:MAG TPA: cyclic nucleotide-binding domain-containing protein [Gemmataceae bacterium]|nr:cyclic nucleotide-binding domain-containing protein [Gemmataceae bacterium]
MIEQGVQASTEQGILELFSSHAFLRGLSEQHRLMLASTARHFQAVPGEHLLREGDEARSFYLIQTGRAAIQIHRPGLGTVRLQTIGPGEIIGWSWIVPPYRWQFDAVAVTTVTGLALDAASLREKCTQDHELGYQLLKELLTVVSGRLSATRLQVLDLYK